MKPVDRNQFFSEINRLSTAGINIHPRIVNDRWPYRSEWRTLDTSRRLIGVSQGEATSPGATAYFLP
jgi:hypothetical protein